MSVTTWFDREEILAALSKRLEGFLAGYRQNIALIGHEFTGKSTLLKRLLHERLPLSPAVVPVYLEIQEGESLPEWSERFVQTLFYGILQTDQTGNGAFPNDIAELKRLCSLRAPKTCSAAEKLLFQAQAGKLEEVYNRIWDLPCTATQETGVPCLLILDEFHRLEQFGVEDPFRRLGRKIMVQNTILYWVVSSQSQLARSILQEGLSLLFGQFEILSIQPLEPPASLKAIRAQWPSEKGDPFLEHLLVELAQGYPASLDLLLRGLTDRPVFEGLEDQERIFLDLLESLLLEPEGILRLRFENRLRLLPPHSSRLGLIQILGSVARGLHRIPEISHALNRPASQVQRSLRVLERAGFLLKQGSLYRIPDRLFHLWLLTAYPILRGIGLTDRVQARVHFRDAAWSWMTRMREALCKPIEEQVAHLLKRWSGESVEMEGRRTLLPEFKKVEHLFGPGSCRVIVAHRSGRSGTSWLVIPWTTPLEEGQARQLVHEIREWPFKYDRKVLLGAYPVDTNARLILQEARLRLWDFQVLNLLLEMYGLARIPPVAQWISPRSSAISILQQTSDESSRAQGRAG